MFPSLFLSKGKAFCPTAQMVFPLTSVFIGFKGKSAHTDLDASLGMFATHVDLLVDMIPTGVTSPSLRQAGRRRVILHSGGGGLSGFSPISEGPQLEGSDWRRDRSDWKLNPAIFEVFHRWAADAYGVNVMVDVYASKFNSQLPLFGISAIRKYWSRICDTNSAIYVNGDWADYARALHFIRSLKVITLVVAPIWPQLQWFKEMVGAATHFWELQPCKDVFLPLSKGHKIGIGAAPWRVGLFICDFRGSNLLRLVRGIFPTVTECLDLVAKTQVKPASNKLFTQDIRPLIKPSPFNLSFLARMSDGVVHPGIRDFVLLSIKDGFRSGYKGSSKIFRDYSKPLNFSQLKIMKSKMDDDVKKGFCLGPFEVCPFPSTWSQTEAICCLQFLRPKHKFKDFGKFRLISHRSFPRGRSFNDLVPRNDCKEYLDNYNYFTVTDFLDLIADFGKGTLIGCFDVKDAYKQCKTHPADLWQQVYRVGNEFYVDLGGMFGSRNAGDAWNLVMELLTKSMSASLSLPNIRYFVDNGVNLTPPVNGQPNLTKAQGDFKNILKFLSDAGVPFHEVVPPSTNVIFLGWQFDTDKMVVSLIPERREWLNLQFKLASKITLSGITSMVGTFEFLATFLVFLKAPLGWLRHRQIELEQGDSKIDDVMKDRVKSYLSYTKELIDNWNGCVPIRKKQSLVGAADCIIFVDASGQVGRGAICLSRNEFALQAWSCSEVFLALRKKAISSTALELVNAGSAICTFAKPGNTVAIFSDSSAAVAIANKKYGRSDNDQWALICLDKFCLQKGITYEFKHLPREDIWIQLCDDLSKGIVCLYLVNCRCC